MKTILYIVGGCLLIFGIACAGCGSVELAASDDGAVGAAGSAAVDGGVVEMTKLETGGHVGAAGFGGGAAGAGGTGGVAGTSGAAGTPAKPPGASCIVDAQCGSGICDTASGTCCNARHKDACSSACVGGVVTVMPDGALCGPGEGPPYSCQAGECKVNPMRPLGAGCTTDTQCASSICAKASPTATSGMCCNGRPDGCNTCVGGYVTPGADGMACGTSLCGGAKHVVPGETEPQSTTATWSTCHAGVCVAKTVDCTQVFTCSDGAQMNLGDPGFCDNSGAVIRCLQYSGTSFVSCSSLGHGEMK